LEEQQWDKCKAQAWSKRGGTSVKLKLEGTETRQVQSSSLEQQQWDKCEAQA